MQRVPVIAYRSSAVTPDTAEALRLLEVQAAKLGGMRIRYTGAVQAQNMEWPVVAKNPGPTSLKPELSMVPSGREIYLGLSLDKYEGQDKAQREISILWSLAIPLGFTPWCRYPLISSGLDQVFHFFGPWRMLFDHLHGEGRGEYAWESVVAAAQSDVGYWAGTKPVERFVQAQLHRLGFHCGLVDGNIGPRTTQALNALGIKGKPLDEIAPYLAKILDEKPGKKDRSIGHVVIPKRRVQATSFGGVHTTQTPNGITLTIDGPGKVLLDIQE